MLTHLATSMRWQSITFQIRIQWIWSFQFQRVLCGTCRICFSERVRYFVNLISNLTIPSNHLLESDVLGFASLPLTCRQFNHSDNVIFLSLFTSQYLGIFLPHFFNALKWREFSIQMNSSVLKCHHANLAAMTSSRNVFHSFRSHTLFLFLSSNTKLSVATRSSSLAQCVVLALWGFTID